MNKRNKIFSIIVVFIVALAVILKEYVILLFLPAALIVFLFFNYDVKKFREKPRKFISFINLIISSILLLGMLMSFLRIIGEIDFLSYNIDNLNYFVLDFDDYIEYFAIIFIALLILRIIILIFLIMFEKFSILKNNKKKIVIAVVILMIFCVLLKNFIIVKIPYKIFDVGDKYWGQEEGIEIIKDINELNMIFSTKYLAEKQEDYLIELIKEFEIDDNFFDNYYLVFVVEVTGNTAQPIGIDDITYNRLSRKINFIQEDFRGNRTGLCVMTTSSYFIKIDKKYNGEIEWKIKYIPF